MVGELQLIQTSGNLSADVMPSCRVVPPCHVSQLVPGVEISATSHINDDFSGQHKHFFSEFW